MSCHPPIPVQQHLVLLGAAHNVEHNVRLHLEDDNLSVIQDDVGRLLGCLLCALSDHVLALFYP